MSKIDFNTIKINKYTLTYTGWECPKCKETNYSDDEDTNIVKDKEPLFCEFCDAEFENDNGDEEAITHHVAE